MSFKPFEGQWISCGKEHKEQQLYASQTDKSCIYNALNNDDESVDLPYRHKRQHDAVSHYSLLRW